MSRATLFPSLEEALFLHLRLLERFGGAPGLRDGGLLESALARPASGYYPSLSMQAAALLQSLARNHAFLDGNKRMAFALAAVFLEANGWVLAVDVGEAERFLVQRVIVGHAELEEITAWIEGHLEEAGGA